MKNNKPISKKGRKSVKKATKKVNVAPLTEFEGEPYNGSRVVQSWSMGKSKWEEQRTGSSSWDIVFEGIAVKPVDLVTTLPVGTIHHSYLLAHQKMVKTSKNTYQVKMEGVKFKMAHQLPGEQWSANAGIRKKNLIKILKEALHNLEMGHGQAPSQTTRSIPAATDDMPGQLGKTRKRKNPKN